MRSRWITLVSPLLLLGVIATATLSVADAPAAAQTTQQATLGPSRDNTLYYHPEGTRSNGLGPNIFVGHTNHGHERRALIAFDLAGAVPEGATIVSATLTLRLSRTHTGPQPITVHRMTADWGEGASKETENVGRGAEAAHGDATWLFPFYSGDRLWKTPGGDFSDISSASTIVDALGPYSWGPTDSMTSDVQSWLDEPETNFGWLLLGNESEPRTTKRFDSKDHPEAARRPVLRITYAPADSGRVLIYVPYATHPGP